MFNSLTSSIRLFTTDQFYLDKVFYSNWYGLKPIDKKDFVVVDIGAHCGFFTTAASSCGASKIYSLEPYIENYQILLKNIEHLPAKVVPFNFGIYVNNNVLRFALPESKNGLYDFGMIGDTGNEQHQNACFSVAYFLNNFVEEEKVDLLKISIGYAEADILFTNPEQLKKVVSICGECDKIDDLDTKLSMKMSAAGFSFSHFKDVPDEERWRFQFSRKPLNETFLEEKQ